MSIAKQLFFLWLLYAALDILCAILAIHYDWHEAYKQTDIVTVGWAFAFAYWCTDIREISRKN